ncbi:MAG: hypothetical protein ACOVLG_01450 [Flavobacterium sp.]
MKIILDRNLVFTQFQNLLILTISCFITWLGLINSTTLDEFIFLKIILFVLILFFIILLLTKKGLFVEKHKIYKGIFLFDILLFKTLITANADKIILIPGNLSTNYNYSIDITEFHNWESDLNHSIKIFTLFLVNDTDNIKRKIIAVRKLENAKEAIEFLTKNTSLKFKKNP